MKKYIALYSLLLLLQNAFADIPIDKYNNIDNSRSFNYLPLAVGCIFALGIFAFMYVLKKENKEPK